MKPKPPLIECPSRRYGPHFLIRYSEKELQDALDWFEINKPNKSRARQKRIREELESRRHPTEEIIKDWNYPFKTQEEREGFCLEWGRITKEVKECLRLRAGL